MSGFSGEESPPVKALGKIFGYRLRSEELLQKALTHPSVSATENYERLEFLGDAVLSAILAEALFRTFPDKAEGELTVYRSALASGKFLSALAEKMELRPWIHFDEAASGGPLASSAVEDVLEALVGAIFLEAGFAKTRRVILKCLGDIRSHLESLMRDYNPKGRIQEYAQSQSPTWSIEYRLVREEGAAPQKLFEVELWLNGRLYGRSHSSSKKRAQEAAAREAIEQLLP
ncbi:MAG: ribonuclease III [Puniceicoccales bacterium]|jgi:ribonuclease-3|nr:ribonuclease III [Puniceicoccales bacterium]